MERFRRILVPTDFSAHSRHALSYALDLARASDGEILLVHVVEPPIYPAMFEGAALVAPAYDEQMQDRIRKHLEQFAKEHLAGAPKVRTALRHGQPVQELCAAAKEENSDVIVLATHGHTGLTHLLLGSTAEQVVRLAPCAVLTVRPPKA
jgi:nucleotide-binding universal stress UspA family protein